MRYLLGIILTSCALISCSSMIISHDEDLAASRAVEFIETAFIKKDLDKGYTLLSANSKRYINFEQFKEMRNKMHPTSFPANVHATDFEPIPGQKGMNIFLTGANGSDSFYYRLGMEGTAQTGYMVSGVYRGNGPYPPSNLWQKLKTPH